MDVTDQTEVYQAASCRQEETQFVTSNEEIRIYFDK
jgi:hypothetical protein